MSDEPPSGPPPPDYLRLAIEQSRMGALAVGADGRLLDIEAVFAGWLGEAREALLGTPLWRWLVDGSPSDWPALWDRLQDTDRRITLDLATPSGARPVQVRAYPAIGPAGEPFVGLTARPIADVFADGIDARETRLDYILTDSDDGIWDWRVDLDRIFVSTAWRRVIGGDLGSIADVRRVWRARGHPDDVPAMEHRIDALLRGEADRYEAEFRMRHADGRWVWLLSRGRVVERDARGRAVRILGSHVDITARRHARTQLEESRARLHDILDGLPIAIALVAADGRSLHHNLACERITGLSRAELADINARDLPWTLYDESGQRVRFPGHEVFAPWLTGRPVRGVVLAHYPLGADEPIWTLSDLIPRFDADGALRDVVCSFADITLLRQIKATLLRTQRFEGLAHLAGGVAHDFNNLLATVLGSAEIASLTVDPEAPVQDDIARIIEAAHRGAALTHQLMTYARSRPSHARLVDLTARLRGADETLRRLVGRGIALDLNLPAEPMRVIIDPEEFDQLVNNLVINARDAMPHGGLLRIELDERPRLSSARGHPIAALRVIDDGEGIAASELPHIFDPFYTTRHLDTGAGLGLATCEGIARQNGGSITARSALGEGSTFEVVLPRAAGPARARPTSQPPAADEDSPRALLLVEPDPTMRELATAGLERTGRRVYAVADARTALDRAAELEHLDALVTAMSLPDDDGASLAARLTAIHPGLPVLFMSGPRESPAAIAPEGVMQPDAAFIFRPFGTTELCARVEALLESHPR